VVAGSTLSREQRLQVLRRVARDQGWAADLLQTSNWDDEAARLSFTIHPDGRVEAELHDPMEF
jgi:hypothetical protein